MVVEPRVVVPWWKTEHRDQWKSHTLPRAQNGGEASSKWPKTEQCAAQQWTNGADNTIACPTQLGAQQPSGCSQHSGSSSAHGDPSATDADTGTTIRFSQLSDRKDDGTAPAYQMEMPPRLYTVLKFDCDTVKVEDHPCFTMVRHSPTFQFDVFTNATTGHMSTVRSPFYHGTPEYKKATRRADYGSTKNKSLKNGTVIVMDLWNMYATELIIK